MVSAGGGIVQAPRTPRTVRFNTGVEPPRQPPGRAPAPRIILTPEEKRRSHEVALQRLRPDPPAPGTPAPIPTWTDESHNDIAQSIELITNSGTPLLSPARPPPPPLPPGPPQSPRPFKRRRTGAAELMDLPDPIRLDFEPHPLEDRSDAWFTEQFRLLFRRATLFVANYFDVHDLSQGEVHQPWAVSLAPEFVRYAEQVAEPDPATGGWDPLLKDTVQRKWLLVGILVRILEMKVFSQNLWGAGTEEGQMLHELDRAFFTHEGFARQALRSETARTVIGRGPVTQNFWSEVATLTAQVSILLKPLTDYLYHLPGAQGVQVPELRDQYQSLHNLISSGAYLSLCIRLSPTIFYFTDAAPGTPFDNDEQCSLEMDLYSQSKQAVVDAVSATRRTYQRNLRIANREVTRLTAEHANQWRMGRAQRQVTALGQGPLLPVQTHRAMVKIGVWPGIRRFKAGSAKEEAEGQRMFLRDKDGFRIYDVSKAAIVCYFGPQTRTVGDTVALAGFVRQKESLYGSLYQRYMLRATVWALIVTGVVCIYLRKEVQENIGVDVGDTLEDFQEFLARVRSNIR